MPEPFRLNALQQQELLNDLTIELVRALPSYGWKRFVMEYQQVGSHVHAAVGLFQPDDELGHWSPPGQTWTYLQTLRDGMYQEDKGTWFSMRYTLDVPDACDAKYNYDLEPDWGEPPAEEFERELEFYPRDERHIPEWFRTRLPAAAE